MSIFLLFYYIYVNYNNYTYNNEIATNEPLFTVDIKIKDNIKKTIKAYPDDQPEKLAYDFCVENMLGKGPLKKFVYIIKEKMDKINGTFNEEINYCNEDNM